MTKILSGYMDACQKSGDCLYNKRTIWLWAAVEKKVFKDVLSENFPYETQRERT